MTSTLTFQTDKPWSPRTNVGGDTVLVYGIDDTISARIQSWKSHGYHTAVMTGVAWGRYGPYLRGEFDGKPHWDETQQAKSGRLFLHGDREIPYIAPGESYGRYLAKGVIAALDAGAEAVYLEEPEFWADAGWSDSFRRSWEEYYHQPWQAPDTSPDTQYRASALKYMLYRRALKQVFDAVRQYGEEHHRTIPCYVATHSLLNYAQWKIVSPELSLLDAGADGFIAQVWTGTARTPTTVGGVTKERTFPAAFLEYGALQNIARSSGKPIWYLNDPIEDNPNHSWVDYRRNWESTLTASLLQPAVSRYEVLPWPSRIFEKDALYPVEEPQQNSAPVRVPIPEEYAAELQTVFHALEDMHHFDGYAKWEVAGTQGIGVLVSDTLMFQRSQPSPSDPNLGNVYGLAMPMLLHGMPVEPVSIESALRDHAGTNSLAPYRVLLLSYEGQKPPSRAFHQKLAAWVRHGGALIVVDDDKDPYNGATAWWNTNGLHDPTPRTDLFRTLGLPPAPNGVKHVGKGVVLYSSKSPTALSQSVSGEAELLTVLHTAAEAIHLPVVTAPALIMRRGPYVVAAGLQDSDDASTTAAGAITVHGDLLDLFDAKLARRTEVAIRPETRAFLLDLDKVESSAPTVLAAAGRIRAQVSSPHKLTFQIDGINETQSIVCIASPSTPASITVAGRIVSAQQYEQSGKILLLHVQNHAEPQQINLEWH